MVKRGTGSAVTEKKLEEGKEKGPGTLHTGQKRIARKKVPNKGGRRGKLTKKKGDTEKKKKKNTKLEKKAKAWG